MVDDARKILRLTTNAFDSEIKLLIDACKSDLRVAGITKIKTTDPLIKRAVLTYVKANFGYEENSEKYQRLPL